MTEIITTNWDLAIESAFHEVSKKLNIISTDQQTGEWNSNEINLIKLHGTLNHPMNLVIADEDYMAYAAEHPSIERIVNAIFLSNTLLFMGFSLTDPNFRRLFAQLQYVPRKFQKPAYALFPREPDVVLKYWSNRGFVIISRPGEDPTEQLQTFVRELVDQTALGARNALDRISLLLRETRACSELAGPDFTIRARGAFGPFGSPEPIEEFRTFSKEYDDSPSALMQDKYEWELRVLIENFLRRGSTLKQIAGPDIQSLRDRYTVRQARRRIETLLRAVANEPNLRIVYRAKKEFERNLFILGKRSLIASWQNLLLERLYDNAEVVLDRGQIEKEIFRFEQEYEQVRQANLERAQTMGIKGTDDDVLRQYVIRILSEFLKELGE